MSGPRIMLRMVSFTAIRPLVLSKNSVAWSRACASVVPVPRLFGWKQGAATVTIETRNLWPIGSITLSLLSASRKTCTLEVTLICACRRVGPLST